jgi:hypothetical protein
MTSGCPRAWNRRVVKNEFGKAPIRAHTRARFPARIDDRAACEVSNIMMLRDMVKEIRKQLKTISED